MKLYDAPGACSLVVRFAELDALPLAPYPQLKSHLTRVSERPRVQESLRAEGLVT